MNDPTLQSLYLLQRPKRYGECLQWEQIFPTASFSAVLRPKIWLEIGFGRGDNLLRLAEQYSTQTHFFVGSEVHAGGTAAVLHRMTTQQQPKESSSFWTGYTLWKPDNTTPCTTCTREPERSHPQSQSTQRVDTFIFDKNDCLEADEDDGHPAIFLASPDASLCSSLNLRSNPYSNLRLHTGDGVKLIACIPDHSLAAVLVTFPDPFFDSYSNEDGHDPRDHYHAECRLLQLDVLAQIWRVLLLSTLNGASGDEEGAGRLYLATDHKGYHAWSHQQVEHFNNCYSPPFLRDPSSKGHGGDDHETAAVVKAHFRCVRPTPDRRQWLPVVSQYEQKGWDEGRSTYLSCWEATVCDINTTKN